MFSLNEKSIVLKMGKRRWLKAGEKRQSGMQGDGVLERTVAVLG